MSEHPAPWRWNGYASMNSDDVGESLLAANGAIVLTTDCDGEPEGHARALVEVAPELEGNARWAAQRFEEVAAAVRAAPPSAHAAIWYSFAFDVQTDARALLAQIEERSRG